MPLAAQPEEGRRLGDIVIGTPLRADYDLAITAWNSARYGVLVGMDQRSAQLVLELDREIDRLIDAALARHWTRSEFRGERRRTGELMAEFIEHTRIRAELSPLDLTTVWTWDITPDSGPVPDEPAGGRSSTPGTS